MSRESRTTPPGVSFFKRGIAALGLAAWLAVGTGAARADSVGDFDSGSLQAGMDFAAASEPFQAALNPARLQRMTCATSGHLLDHLVPGTIPSELSRFHEKEAIAGMPLRLFALSDRFGQVHPERPPLVLIHGMFGSPSDLQAIADHYMKAGHFQVYVLAYREATRPINDNAEDIAVALHALKAQSRGARREGVTIIAHSLGGLIARATLNALAVSNAHGHPFGRVHLIAVDSPWHGFPGPSDRGIDQLPIAVAGAVLPAGLMDMRARSNFFFGTPDARDPLRRRGALRTVPDEDMKVDLIFAQEGSEAFDYTEGPLTELPALLAYRYNNPTRSDFPSNDPRIQNFWLALVGSTQFYSLDLELENTAGHRKLEAADVLDALQRYFPRYPGNHMTVLQEHPGQVSALDAIDKLVQ